MNGQSVAIIGAGMSGAVCAKALTGLVDQLVVFEQEAHGGGRLKSVEHLSTTPFFTISTVFFENVVDSWAALGWVSDRSGWDVEISATEIHSINNEQLLIEAKPSSLSLIERLLSGTNVRYDTEITDIEQNGKKWRLFDSLGNYCGLFDVVIFSSLADSVLDLAHHSSELVSKMQSIRFSSAWVVVLFFEDDFVIPYDSAVFLDSPIASFFVSKHNQQTCISLLANPEWSDEFSATPHTQVEQLLKAEFIQRMDLPEQAVVNMKSKFWQQKLPINSLDEDCWFDDNLGLGACGDWCVSPRLEGAVLSGFSVADRLMKFMNK